MSFTTGFSIAVLPTGLFSLPPGPFPLGFGPGDFFADDCSLFFFPKTRTPKYP